ncbi:hypothetical protein H8959_002269 [Pygathrix nigripes]
MLTVEKPLLNQCLSHGILVGSAFAQSPVLTLDTVLPHRGGGAMWSVFSIPSMPCFVWAYRVADVRAMIKPP